MNCKSVYQVQCNALRTHGISKHVRSGHTTRKQSTSPLSMFCSRSGCSWLFSLDTDTPTGRVLCVGLVVDAGAGGARGLDVLGVTLLEPGTRADTPQNHMHLLFFRVSHGKLFPNLNLVFGFLSGQLPWPAVYLRERKRQATPTLLVLSLRVRLGGVGQRQFHVGHGTGKLAA